MNFESEVFRGMCRVPERGSLLAIDEFASVPRCISPLPPSPPREEVDRVRPRHLENDAISICSSMPDLQPNADVRGLVKSGETGAARVPPAPQGPKSTGAPKASARASPPAARVAGASRRKDHTQTTSDDHQRAEYVLTCTYVDGIMVAEESR